MAHCKVLIKQVSCDDSELGRIWKVALNNYPSIHMQELRNILIIQ